VQSAFEGSLDDFAVNGNLAQVAERGLLDCQIEENALYTTSVCRGRTTQGQPEGQNAGTANGDASKKIAIIVTKVPLAAPVRSPLLDCRA
jgi:hypothetical protein